jgi:hypothetical protein
VIIDTRGDTYSLGVLLYARGGRRSEAPEKTFVWLIDSPVPISHW